MRIKAIDYPTMLTYTRIIRRHTKKKQKRKVLDMFKKMKMFLCVL